MVLKAKPRPSAKEQPLPLDSGCWRLVIDVYKQLKEEHSDPDIMLLDLFEAMDDGRVRHKSRQTRGGRKHALEPPGWLSEWERNSAPDGLSDLWLQRLEESGILRQAKSGVVFYVWEPDLVERLWPPCEECAKPEPEIDERSKPGPRPKTNWKLHATAELCRTGIEGRQTPTPVELADFLAKLNLHPDSSEVQKLRKALVRLLF
jgi:hypothetical protein